MSWVEQKGVRLTTTEALIAILGYIGFFTVKRLPGLLPNYPM